jgi:Acyl-CoA synthetases (AMP-forming)/AMP-acid ligases II
MPNCTTFLDANASSPSRVALIVPSTGEGYTRAELLDLVSRVGRGFQGLGITGRGTGLYLPSTPQPSTC